MTRGSRCVADARLHVNTTRLLLLCMALSWLTDAGAVRADALRKVDKQAAGVGGGERRVRAHGSGHPVRSASPQRERNDATDGSLHWTTNEHASQSCDDFGESSGPHGCFALALVRFTIGLPW